MATSEHVLMTPTSKDEFVLTYADCTNDAYAATCDQQNLVIDFTGTTSKTVVLTLPNPARWAWSFWSVHMRNRGTTNTITLVVAQAENWSNLTLNLDNEHVILFSTGSTAREIYSNLA